MRKNAISTALTLLFLFGAHSVDALTVSPVKLEVRGAPGQTISGEIELLNEQGDTRTFFSSFENFEPSGDSGSPHFVGKVDGLATWIATDASVVLAPDERKIVPFSIKIPEDAEPGGYFSGIFFGGQNVAGQNGGEVSIGGKLGVLVLLRVEGDIEEKGGLLNFMTASGKRFFAQLPLSFSYKFNNQGADRLVPLGDISITNTFGITAARIPANANEGSILPNSARTYTSTWDPTAPMSDTVGFFNSIKYQFNNLHIGWYTAHLDIVWGIENTQSQARYDFILFPWQLSLVLLLGLFGVWFILKKYNKWIVARSKK